MKIAPLKGTAAFARTMRSGKRFTEQSITAIVTFRRSSTGADSSLVESDIVESVDAVITLGVSIRKKTAKKATVRNRAKRLLRQSVRIVVGELEKYGEFAVCNSFDRVILFCNSAPATASQMHIEDILGDVRAVFRAAIEYSQKYSLVQ
jgi:ribonuclease P protein component